VAVVQLGRLGVQARRAIMRLRSFRVLARSPLVVVWRADARILVAFGSPL